MHIKFPCTPEIADFVNDIAAHMVLLFDIPLVEAEGRINRFWGGNSFLDEGDRIILHETSEYWAKTIYYGPGVMWWLGEEELSPKPYP